MLVLHYATSFPGHFPCFVGGREIALQPGGHVFLKYLDFVITLDIHILPHIMSLSFQNGCVTWSRQVFTTHKLTPELNSEQLNAAMPAFRINMQEFSENNIYSKLVLCFNPESFLHASLPFSSIYLSLGVSCSLVAVVLVFVFAFSARSSS